MLEFFFDDGMVDGKDWLASCCNLPRVRVALMLT